MVKHPAPYEHAVLAGKLAQLSHGIAERGHLFLGETPDAGHEDFLLVSQQVKHDSGNRSAASKLQYAMTLNMVPPSVT
jgi:hypothetical protein